MEVYCVLCSLCIAMLFFFPMAFQYMDLLYEVFHNAHTNTHSHGAIFHVQYSKVVFLAEIP